MARSGTKRNWIKQAIRNPGALRRQAAKEGAITKQGTISTSWLRKKAAQGNTTVARRARLALTLRRLGRRKKK